MKTAPKYETSSGISGSMEPKKEGVPKNTIRYITFLFTCKFHLHMRIKNERERQKEREQEREKERIECVHQEGTAACLMETVLI